MKIYKELNQVQRAFMITSLILLFQILRNISSIGYVAILFSSYAWLYATYFLGNKHICEKNKFVFKPMELIFLLSLLWIPFISLINMDLNEFIVSLPRYLITFPYFLFCFMYKGFDNLTTKYLLRLFVYFNIIASVTIPFQIIFGPISFFTEPSYREGLVRYTSLAGSLTILGTTAGIALGILLFSGEYLFNKSKKNILTILLVLCMLMTLQKSAVVNILVCSIFYFLLYGDTRFIKKVGFIILSFFVISTFLIIFSENELVLYIDKIVNYTFSSSSVGLINDFLIRIFYLPSKVVTYNDMSFIDYMFGIGFPSLAGTMGNPQYPMAHNNYVDLLFSGGILHLVSYLYLLLRIPCSAIKKMFHKIKLSDMENVYSITIVIILINMLIGAVTFYQPVTAVIVYFLIFSFKK